MALDYINLLPLLLSGMSSLFFPYTLLLLPIMAESSRARDGTGQAILSIGFILSAASVGVFAVTIGTYNYVNLVNFRMTCSTVMSMAGIAILFVSVSEDLELIHRIGLEKLKVKFILGLLLGSAWIACLAPELYDIVISHNAMDTSGMTPIAVMFSLGAMIPLAVLGTGLKPLIQRWRNKIPAGKLGEIKLFGGILLLTGLLIMTGLDQKVFQLPRGQTSLMVQSFMSPKPF